MPYAPPFPNGNDGAFCKNFFFFQTSCKKTPPPIVIGVEGGGRAKCSLRCWPGWRPPSPDRHIHSILQGPFRGSISLCPFLGEEPPSGRGRRPDRLLAPMRPARPAVLLPAGGETAALDGHPGQARRPHPPPHCRAARSPWTQRPTFPPQRRGTRATSLPFSDPCRRPTAPCWNCAFWRSWTVRKSPGGRGSPFPPWTPASTGGRKRLQEALRKEGVRPWITPPNSITSATPCWKPPWQTTRTPPPPSPRGAGLFPRYRRWGKDVPPGPLCQPPPGPPGPETGSAVGPVRGHPAGGVGGDGVDGGAGGPRPPRHLEF